MGGAHPTRARGFPSIVGRIDNPSHVVSQHLGVATLERRIDNLSHVASQHALVCHHINATD